MYSQAGMTNLTSEDEGLLKECLKAVYVLQIEEGHATPQKLSHKTGFSKLYCSKILSKLEAEGMVRQLNPDDADSQEYLLTEEGRSKFTVVLTGGVFDIIHVGHLATLWDAKALGDVLVVVVARDETVERLKGRKPINKEEDRLKVVQNLKPVDLALLGDKSDPYKIVKRLRPDIIALGYDQIHKEDEIQNHLGSMGLKTKVVRLKAVIPKVKTSLIISKIQNSP